MPDRAERSSTTHHPRHHGRGAGRNASGERPRRVLLELRHPEMRHRRRERPSEFAGSGPVSWMLISILIEISPSFVSEFVRNQMQAMSESWLGNLRFLSSKPMFAAMRRSAVRATGRSPGRVLEPRSSKASTRLSPSETPALLERHPASCALLGTTRGEVA